MRNSKVIGQGLEAKLKMFKGVEKLSEAVGSTLGPGGRLVGLQRAFGPVKLTKDGVTVAKEIEFADEFENAGAQICKQTSIKCAEVAGDGTTTTSILCANMIKDGLQHLVLGRNPQLIKKGMEKALSLVLETLKPLSKSVVFPKDGENLEDTDIYAVARISSNSMEDGLTVVKAFHLAGENGTVVHEHSKLLETQVVQDSGIKVGNGFPTPIFVTNATKRVCELENPYVLIWPGDIADYQEILPLMEQLITENKGRPILIVCDEMRASALQIFVTNIKQWNPNKTLIGAYVQSPEWGERRRHIMEDLAILTGCAKFDSAVGRKLSEVKLEELGSAARVVVTEATTLIFDPQGEKEKVDEHVAGLEEQTKSLESKTDREKFKERISLIKGRIATIKVGGFNESEISEHRDRIEDAICAVKAAVESGVIPGGATPLLKAQLVLEKKMPKDLSQDEKIGWTIVQDSLSIPFSTICKNAGYNPDVLAEAVRKKLNLGRVVSFDPLSNKFVDPYKSKILDPLKVTTTAVENAVSMASLFLITDTIIVDDKEEKDKKERLY